MRKGSNPGSLGQDPTGPTTRPPNKLLFSPKKIRMEESSWSRTKNFPLSDQRHGWLHRLITLSSKYVYSVIEKMEILTH